MAGGDDDKVKISLFALGENGSVTEQTKLLLPKYSEISRENVMDILKEEVGQTFVHVLEDAGVYKCNEEGRKAFLRFIETL